MTKPWAHFTFASLLSTALCTFVFFFCTFGCWTQKTLKNTTTTATTYKTSIWVQFLLKNTRLAQHPDTPFFLGINSNFAFWNTPQRLYTWQSVLSVTSKKQRESQHGEKFHLFYQLDCDNRGLFWLIFLIPIIIRSHLLSFNIACLPVSINPSPTVDVHM